MFYFLVLYVYIEIGILFESLLYVEYYLYIFKDKIELVIDK